MRKKKGQGGEMMGLLVIIILIIVLGVMYFKYASKPDSTIIQESRKSVESSNYLRAMQQYTLCQDKDLEDAIKECVKNDGGPICGFDDSCDLIKAEVTLMLNASYSGEIGKKRIIFYVDEKTGTDEYDNDIFETKIQVPEGDDAFKCGSGQTKVFSSNGMSLFPGYARIRIGRCTS